MLSRGARESQDNVSELALGFYQGIGAKEVRTLESRLPLSLVLSLVL